METIAAFIERNGLAMRATPTDHNPHRAPDDKWAHTASHYRCTIRTPLSRRMVVYYSMGTAHTEPPTLADVLDCLASDASGLGGTFEEWCGDYGYDADSIRAFKTYHAVKRQTAALKRVLGDAEFELLVYKTERL